MEYPVQINRIKTRVLLILFGFVAFNSISTAQTVAIVGTGTSTCRQFSEAVSVNPIEEREYFSWAQGFMSGILFVAPIGVDERMTLLPMGFPIAAQLAFLRAYCGRFPEVAYSDGVEALYRELGGTAVK